MIPPVEEVRTHERLWAFDGRVLEVFNFPGRPTARFHAALMGLEVSGPDRKGRMKIELRYFREKEAGLHESVESDDFVRLEPLLDSVRQAIR